MSGFRRPTTIHEVEAVLSRFRSPAATAALETFIARPSDVFICTYSKSGTTWMQQIVQQLRSGGSMAFAEISEVVPWLESAVDMGVDPSADQAWEPRAFKSHLMWRDIPKGGRYITVFRDPRTVLPSFYRFFEGWFFEPGSVSIEEFAHTLYLRGSAAGRHWDHLVDWWDRIGDDDVLALAYEDMLAAPDEAVVVVAEFLGLDLDARTVDTAVERSSRRFMQGHADRFDDHLLRRHRDPVWGLPPGGESAKVTSGSQVELGPALERQLDDVWAEVVTPRLGFASYEELRAAMPNPLGVDR